MAQRSASTAPAATPAPAAGVPRSMVTPYGQQTVLPGDTPTQQTLEDREAEMRRLERIGWGFWGLTAVVVLSLTIATAVLYVFTLTGASVPWKPASQSTLLTALGGLVVLFVFYVFSRQQQLSRLRMQLLRSQMTASALESSLSDATGLFEASVDLAISGDPRRLSASGLSNLRAAVHADVAALYVVDDEHGAELVVCDPPLSRTYSGPSLDALARRALASPPEHPQARALPRAVYAGTALVAPFVTGMRPGGQRAALYVARDPRAQVFTDQEKRLLASFAAHLGAALGRGILPALGSLQWLDPTRAAGAAPADVLLQQRAPSPENPAEPSREATAPAVLPARRRAHAVSAKPERPSEDAPKAVRSTRPRSRPPAALSPMPPPAPEAAPAEAPVPTPPPPPAAPSSRRSRTKTPLLAA